MVNRLPSWLFLSLAMLTMGFALFPVMRVIVGVDEEIEIQFLTVVSLLIAGLMCGLTAMLLMVKRQPDIAHEAEQQVDTVSAAKLHACGLLLVTGVPLANFIACYYLWLKYRHRSGYLDYQGREAICFQISIYLYLLIGFLMVFAIVGVFALPLLIVYHLVVTIAAILYALSGKAYRYPANITIIARAPNKIHTAA